MAKVVRKYIQVNTSVGVNAVKQLIDSMQLSCIKNTSVTEDSGNTILTINIDDIVTLILTYSSSLVMSYTYNGQTNTLQSINKGEHIVTICGNDNLFYISTGPTTQYFAHQYLFLYEQIDGHHFVGGIKNLDGTAHFTPISSIANFTEIETGVIYTHGALLNYSADVNTIQYINHDILLNGGVKSYNDANFIACSTITQDRVLTIRGKNYFSVSTNSLLPIDDEESNNG